MNTDIKLRLNDYLRTIGHTTPEERGKLRSWIRASGTAYCNPWEIHEENGRYMDYISALRVVREMQENSSEFYAEESLPSSENEDELPF